MSLAHLLSKGGAERQVNCPWIHLPGDYMDGKFKENEFEMAVMS
jgi:hypothetical protein